MTLPGALTAAHAGAGEADLLAALLELVDEKTTSMRVPALPGRPSATAAPPLTLTMSASRPISRVASAGDAAKASFSSVEHVGGLETGLAPSGGDGLAVAYDVGGDGRRG